jgi:sugar-specific transcriptional regulator TrmB
MDKLVVSLQNLDLTAEEIQVYLASLEEGNSTILALAQTTGIPRTTVYLLVESLEKKGLLVLTILGKKKHYIPASPQELVSLAQKKQEQYKVTAKELEQNIPELQALYNLKHERPKIRYYEGTEGIKKIYEETLSVEKIYVHCMTQDAREIMGSYLDTYFTRVIRKMIFTQEIVSDSDVDKEYQKEYSTSRNEIITISQKYITNTDYMIYGNCIAFITYKDKKPVGIVIEDPEIAHFERIKFMLIWKIAKENKLE